MIFLTTVKFGSSNGGESYEKYRNPGLLGRKSRVTTGYPALRLDAVYLSVVLGTIVYNRAIVYKRQNTGNGYL